MSFLRQGNLALRRGLFEEAIHLFVMGLRAQPELGRVYAMNIQRARTHRDNNDPSQQSLRVGVCVWEMSHNPVGRGLAIAEAYQESGSAVPIDVELLGPCYEAWGGEVWKPLRSHSISGKTFKPHAAGTDNASIFQAYYNFVCAHPKDIVHLIKPRGPALFLGLLYQAIHHSAVVFDCDDEELSFFNQGKNLRKVDQTICQLVKGQIGLPALKDLPNKVWTHISIYLLHHFSAVTVSNPALHARYGGTIIPHSRSSADFPENMDSRREVQQNVRKRFGIPQDAVVVLFSGTPRKHKGLERTAEALRAITPRLPCKPLLVVVGDFPKGALSAELEAILPDQLIRIPGQPYADLANVAAIGDLTVLLQEDTLVSQFQVPAKITEALAAGLLVLTTRKPGLEDFIHSRAAIEVDHDNLERQLHHWISRLNKVRAGEMSPELLQQWSIGKDYFSRFLSHLAVGERLLNLSLSAFTKSSLNWDQVNHYSYRQHTLRVPESVNDATEFKWYLEGSPRQWKVAKVLRETSKLKVSRVVDSLRGEPASSAYQAVEKTSIRTPHSLLEGQFYLARELHSKDKKMRRSIADKVRDTLFSDAPLIRPQLPASAQQRPVLATPQLLEIDLDLQGCRIVLEDIQRPSVRSIGELGDYRTLSLDKLLCEIASLNNSAIGNNMTLTEPSVDYLSLGSGSRISELLQPLKVPSRQNYFDQAQIEGILHNQDVQWLCAQADDPIIATQKLNDLVSKMIKLSRRINVTLQACPLVFSHNDLNRGNVYFDGALKQFLVLDWGTLSYSPVGSDLAQLLHPSFWTKPNTVYRDWEQLSAIENHIIYGLSRRINFNHAQPGKPSTSESDNIWIGYLTRLLTQQFALHLPRYAAQLGKSRAIASNGTLLQKLNFLNMKLSQLAALVE